MSENTKLLKTKRAYSGRYLDFMERTFIDKEGDKKVWEYVTRKNDFGVVSIIVHNKNEFILIKEFRQSLQKYIIDFPAGFLDNAGDIVEEAKREFEEETGLQLIDYKYAPFCSAYSSPGLTDEKIYTIVFDESHYLHPTKQKLGTSEIIEVLRVPDTDLYENILNFSKENVKIGSRLLNFAIGLYYGQKISAR